jgi:hypothetical protein
MSECYLELLTKKSLSSRSGGVTVRMPSQTGSNLFTWRMIGSFHTGAGGYPGIPNHNQCDESLFRVIKRIIRTKATVEYFFERSVPDMLAHLDLHFSFERISRGVEGADCLSGRHQQERCHQGTHQRVPRCPAKGLLMERHCSLHEVVQYFDKPEDRNMF